MSHEHAEAETEAAPAVAAAEPAPAGFAPAALTPTVAGLLSLQRAAGNAAVGRWLARQSPAAPPAPSPKTDDGGAAEPHLPPGAAWAIPLKIDKNRLLDEAMQIAGDMAFTADPTEAGRDRYAGFKRVNYFVVTDKLYHFDANGMPAPVASYDLVTNATTFPPGYYLSTREASNWKRMFRTPFDEYSPVHFGPWTFKDPKLKMENWLKGGAETVEKLFGSFPKGTEAVIMAVSPLGKGGTAKIEPPPPWAAKLAQAALGKVTRKGRALKPGEKPPEDQVDELIPYKKGDKVYVQVGAEGGKKAIPVKEGDTPDDLAAKASKAAKELRRERDPEQSKRLAGSDVTSTGVTKEAHGATVGGVNLRTEEQRKLVPPGLKGGANAAPYPATMVMAGASPGDPESHKTVLGATNRFQMNLAFGFGGYNSINLITNQMQPIQYYWEVVDVTTVKPQGTPEDTKLADLEDTSLGLARDTKAGLEHNEAATGEVRDIKRKWGEYVEDTKADLAGIDKVPWVLRYNYLQTIALSGVIRSLGSVVDAFISRVSTPLNEKTIGFDSEGDFVVRCIATPITEPGAEVRRASSIAARVVRVTTVRHRAEEADREEDDRINADRKKLADLRAKAALSDDPAAYLLEIEDVQDDLKEAEYLKSHDHSQNTSFLIERYKQRLGWAKQIKEADAGHVPNRKRSPEARKFALKLGRYYEIDNVIKGLEHTIKEMEALWNRLTFYGALGEVPSAIRLNPKVTLASEENGQVYRLMSMLVQTKRLETDKVVEYRFADVTSKGSQQEYRGRSTKEGREGHDEAIERAFTEFCENNEYGRGTVRIRLKGALPGDLGQIDYFKERRSTKGERARALQKLKDIATAAEIAGMVVGGPAGAVIGIAGGLAGAALAAENLHKKSTGGRLELDFETVMDVVGVVGGIVGAGGGATGLLSQTVKRGSTAARVLSVTGEYVHVLGKGQLAGQVIAVPFGYVVALNKIEQEIKDLPEDQRPMPGELALRRAEAFQQFAWGCFTTTVSAMQMGGLEPLVGGEKLTGKHAAELGKPAPKEVDVKGAGGPGGKPPAPPPAPAPEMFVPKEVPHRLVHPNEVSMMVDKAIGKRGEPLRVGRVKVVPTEVLNSVHEHVNGKPMPDGAVGMFDPTDHTLYIGKEGYTPERHQQVLKGVEARITGVAKNKYGSQFADGFRSLSQRLAVEGSGMPVRPGSRPGELMVARLAEFIPLDTLAAAMTGNEFAGVHEALVDRFGNARANAIEQAMAQNRAFDVLTMLDLPRGELGSSYGSFLADGISDFISGQRGGKPVNAERAKLIGEIAKRVGLDVLRGALYEGNVAPLERALETSMGTERATALKDALLSGDAKQIRQALKEPQLKPAPKPAEGGAPAKKAAPAAEPKPPKAPEPLKPAVVEAQQKLAAALHDNPRAAAGSLAEPAGNLIHEAGNFKALRDMVDSGAFGTSDAAKARAQDVLHKARVEMTNRVLEAVLKKLAEKYDNVVITLSDMGTPGFGSDRDITMKAKERAGKRATVNELVAASVEGVQMAYDALNQAGLPPDAALDSNFYTELHEPSVKPSSAAERQAISKAQDVVSLTELRMNIGQERWEAYKREQLKKFAESAEGFQGAVDARAKGALLEQFAAAEARAKDLTSGSRESVLRAKQNELLKALAEKEPPASPERIRDLMADIKLLEPDAYGTRAAVEGVVDFQQALARASDAVAAGPILKGRAGRVGERAMYTSEEYAILAQEATASLGKLMHAHAGKASKPSQAAGVSKYLGRIVQAFMEAGLSIAHPLLDKAGQVVGAKAVSPEAIMREIRAWGDTRGLGSASNEELLGAYVEACEKLGLDLTMRLRAVKEGRAAQEAELGVTDAEAQRAAGAGTKDIRANEPKANADPKRKSQLALDQLAGGLSPAGREWLAKQRRTRSDMELEEALGRAGSDEGLLRFIENQAARDYATYMVKGSGAVRDAALKALEGLRTRPISEIGYLLNELRTNAPAGSSNARVLEYIETVWRGTQSPEILAAVCAEIHAEAQRSGISHTDAVVKLSRESGARVVEIRPNPPGERPGLDAKQFYDEHASQGHRFLDLNIGPNSDHGATTHLIQELAVDRALREAGYSSMRSEQFRELLGAVVGEPHANRPLGDRLWRALYDGEFDRAINEPESLFPVLKKVLPGLT